MNYIQTVCAVTAGLCLVFPEKGMGQSETMENGLAELDRIEASLLPEGQEQGFPQPSDNATINLVRLLVQRGILSHEDSVALIRQAEDEAVLARAQSEAVQAAAAEVRAAAEAELSYHEEDVRVTYVPEHVRQEIAADVRHDMMEQAKRENWMAPRNAEGTKELSIFGDFRMRYEGIGYPSGNANAGMFPDFNQINTGAPYNASATPPVLPPMYNVNQDRERTRIRARIGLEADIGEGLMLGFRMATGSGSSPVSTNQTLGSPGNFSKYSVWLDRAFLRWQTEGVLDFSISFGRFNNPFFSTDMLWDRDIGMDGVAIQLRRQLGEDASLFLTGGAFPVFNSSLNFPANQPSKFKSDDRYLYAVQGGIEYDINKNIKFKVGAAYYHFQDVEGKLSTPYMPLTANDAGDTDGRRPPFAQKGNTYMELRSIIPNISNDNHWQYYGLATPFHTAALTAQLDFNHFEPFQVSLFGEVAKNLAFNSSDINNIALNNRGPNIGAMPGNFEGGSLGWIAGVNVGHAVLQSRWDWVAGVSYRYQESDYFVDGFVDSDFGLGGTNVKGFTLGGSVALFPSVQLGIRWMSASEVAGPAFRTDIIQLDLSAQF